MTTNSVDNDTKAIIKKFFNTQGIVFDEHKEKQLLTFFDFVTSENKKINLTSIIDKQQFYIKHYIDSISAQEFLAHNAKVLDLGCGAGFPSVPLKIARDDLSIVALDSTEKKIRFVKQAIELLKLKNFTAVASRAEEYIAKKRESFDCVTSRAVASLSTLLELSLPFVKKEGLFIAYKTNESELQNTQNALKILGAKLEKAHYYTLPDESKRCLLVFVKTKNTPSCYPRNFSQIKKNPL